VLENVSDDSEDHIAFIFKVENQEQGGKLLAHQNDYCFLKDSATWSQLRERLSEEEM
jgi:hypothetical protein